MPHRLHSKGASRPGALFVFGCLLAGIPPLTAADCPAPGRGETVRVARVYDGDTVRLVDGRRLRLIGINAPETGRNDRPPRPFADEATAMLGRLLGEHGHSLTLQYGEQPRDRYDRLLAHALLPDGGNPAVELLESGLATALAVPPNTRAAECYRRIETRARNAGRGIWALPEYRPVPAADLEAGTRGFRLVRGRVTELRRSRYSLWLQLDGPLVAHIARKDLAHFPAGFPESLHGERVELRGWLKPDRGGLKVNIRHPAALQHLGPADPEENSPND